MVRIKAAISRISEKALKQELRELAVRELQKMASDHAARAAKRVLVGIQPDGTAQKEIRKSTKRRGSQKSMIRSGLLTQKWRVLKRRNGAKVTVHRKRLKTEIINHQRGFKIVGLDADDRKAEKEVGVRSDKILQRRLRSLIHVDEVG
jgi:hypothetical protein